MRKEVEVDLMVSKSKASYYFLLLYRNNRW